MNTFHLCMTVLFMVFLMIYDDAHLNGYAQSQPTSAPRERSPQNMAFKLKKGVEVQPYQCLTSALDGVNGQCHALTGLLLRKETLCILNRRLGVENLTSRPPSP